MKERKEKMVVGYFAALAATAIWSGNFIVARGLSETISPISLAFCRWSLAFLALLPFAFRPFWRERALLRRHLPYLTAVAFIGVTLFNTMIYYAGRTTTAMNLSLISISAPIFIVIFSRFLLGEKITLRKCLGIFSVVLGVLLLITGGKFQVLLSLSFTVGDLWMLGAAHFFALYTMLLRYKPKELSVWSFQLFTFGLGLLFLLPPFLFELYQQPVDIFRPENMVGIIYIGLCASLTAFLLWGKAISLIGPSKAGMIYYSLPLFSGVAANLLLDERISVVHLGSALLIISGIVVANSRSRKTL